MLALPGAIRRGHTIERPMNRLVRSTFSLCAGFGLALGAIAVADRNQVDEVPAGTVLGGVNFGNYCSEVYGRSATARLNESQGAFGWRCWTTTNNIIAYEDIDLHEACEFTFGAPTYERTNDINDPYSWECLRGPQDG